MSSWGPLTEWSRPSQELKNFTDRENESRVFERLLYLPAGVTLPVLCFYGVGGTGKTWLAKRLREVARTIVPTARLDFDPEAGGARLHDASHALAEIRIQYRDITCPRFDLAYAWVRFKEGAGGEPQFHGEGSLAQAWELVSEVAEAAATDAALVPGANVVKWFMQKLSLPARRRFRQSRIADWLDSQLGSNDWQKLRGADRDDTFRELPLRLVRDLNERLPPRPTMACRAVLFLDSFETLEQGLEAEQQIHNREAAFRALYHPESPLLLVICGRDRLRWGGADIQFMDARHLEQHLIGGLSEADASRFLTNCGIADRLLQLAVLRVSVDVETPAGTVGAHDRAHGYHPFSLGLCADTISATAQSGGAVDPGSLDMAPGDTQALARRFLRSLADATAEVFVNRLAWTPRFDEDAARAAFGGTRAASHQEAEWKQIQALSFIQRADRDGWYRVHSRMRFALSHIEASRQGSTHRHQFWREYWVSRSRTVTDEFAQLAWYHEWHLAPIEALGKWRQLIENARQAGRMVEHFSLLGWWSETDLLKRTPTPNDVPALNSLALEMTRSTLGDPTARLKHAIAFCEAALRTCDPNTDPQDWAEAQHTVGAAYGDLRSGDRSENLNTAIRCFQAALKVGTERAFPQRWAATQHVLGKAYAELTEGDLSNNLKSAIACYQAALRFRTEEAFPWEWARTQINLGGAYHRLPTGDRAENLNSAIACYKAALRVCTETTNAREWALLQSNLGASIYDMPGGDERERFESAIACFKAAQRVLSADVFPQDWAHVECTLAGIYQRSPFGSHEENVRTALDRYTAALRIYTEESYPLEWAAIQESLGRIHQRPPADSHALGKVVACYQAALRVYTETEYPSAWAQIQHNLGGAYQQLTGDDREANLTTAIACYQAALRVRREEASPQDWAVTQESLAVAYQAASREVFGDDQTKHLEKAIGCYQAALRVYTEEESSLAWARVQCGLGTAHQQLPMGDRVENLTAAIRCHEAALRILREDAQSLQWATTQHNLGVAYQQLSAGDRAENLTTAIGCYRAALRVYSEAAQASEWAGTQHGLGTACLELPAGDRTENVTAAIASYQAALRVYRESANPLEWAAAQCNLGAAYQQLPIGDAVQNLRTAIACYEAALRVYHEDSHQAEWKLTQDNLGMALASVAAAHSGGDVP